MRLSHPSLAHVSFKGVFEVRRSWTRLPYLRYVVKNFFQGINMIVYGSHLLELRMAYVFFHSAEHRPATGNGDLYIAENFSGLGADGETCFYCSWIHVVSLRASSKHQCLFFPYGVLRNFWPDMDESPGTLWSKASLCRCLQMVHSHMC